MPQRNGYRSQRGRSAVARRVIMNGPAGSTNAIMSPLGYFGGMKKGGGAPSVPSLPVGARTLAGGRPPLVNHPHHHMFISLKNNYHWPIPPVNYVWHAEIAQGSSALQGNLSFSQLLGGGPSLYVAWVSLPSGYRSERNGYLLGFSIHLEKNLPIYSIFLMNIYNNDTDGVLLLSLIWRAYIPSGYDAGKNLGAIWATNTKSNILARSINSPNKEGVKSLMTSLYGSWGLNNCSHQNGAYCAKASSTNAGAIAFVMGCKTYIEKHPGSHIKNLPVGHSARSLYNLPARGARAGVATLPGRH